MVIIVPPNKLASNSTAGVTDLIDRFYGSIKKVLLPSPFHNLSHVCGCNEKIWMCDVCLQSSDFKVIATESSFMSDILIYAGCVGPLLF